MAGSQVVSVIVPSYNHAAYIEEALLSALDQTLAPAEVLVVDDGSTDGTAAVLARFGGRIRTFAREHRGVAEAYNFGVAQARGEWIAFLESDDAFEPAYLAEVFDFLGAHPELRWVSTTRRVVGPDGRPTGETQRKPSPGPLYTTRSFLRHDLGCASTPVVRKDALLAVGPFDPRTYGADTDMALRFSLKFPMGFLDRPLYRYRRHPGNISWSTVRNAKEVFAILERRRDEDPDFAKANGREIRRALAKYRGMVGALLLETDPSIGRAEVLPWFREAVRRDPLRLKHWRRFFFVLLLGPASYSWWRNRERRRRGRGGDSRPADTAESTRDA